MTLSTERTTLATIYRQCAQEMVALFTEAAPHQLDAVVTACPQWTARDLLAHLAGASSDIRAGRMDDAPSPAWTGRQVVARRGRPVAELTAELLDNAEAVAAGCVEGTGPSPAWDISVHLGDVHEAWSLPSRPAVLEGAAPAVVADSLGFLAAIGALPGPIGAEGGVLFGADGRTPATLGSDYELFRALFGRRTRRQIQTQVVAGDPETILAAVFFDLPDEAG